MVIDDLNVECVAGAPFKADPILIVDPDAVLACAASFERFKVVAGKKSQIREQTGGMNLNEFSLNCLSKPIEMFGISAAKNELCISGSKRSNHSAIIVRYTYHVKMSWAVAWTP
jgi:hypothetical protein